MFKQYRKIRNHEYIVVGGDCSAGGTDNSCCQFISKNCLDVPLVYHSPDLSTVMTNDILPVLEKICDMTGIPPLIAYECNNGGIFEMERLATLNRKGKFQLFVMQGYGQKENVDGKKYGWDTNSATRPEMLKCLKEAIDKRLITIYDQETIEECFSFIVNHGSHSWKAEAEYNCHDDRVMALAIAWQLFLMSKSPTEMINTHNGTYEDSYRHRHEGY